MFVDSPGGPLLGPLLGLPYLLCMSLISCLCSACCFCIMAIIAAICTLRFLISNMFGVSVVQVVPGLFRLFRFIARSRGSGVIQIVQVYSKITWFGGGRNGCCYHVMIWT